MGASRHPSGGFWTVAIGESNQDLYYLLEWESLAERDEKWAAFQADPEWGEKRAKTEANGPIVSKITNAILQPTSFSSALPSLTMSLVR